MDKYFVIIFNIILIIVFSFNICFLLYRYYRDISLEQVSWEGQEDNKNKDFSESSNDPVIWDQINIIRNKFYTNFILVELSLIVFFLFWGIVIFYKIPIV